MNAWLAVILIVLLALFGAPLFSIIATFALYGFSSSGTDASAVIIELYRIADSAALVAIPLFTFAGYMLAESKSPQRLVALARALVGSFPGGISFVVLGVCAFFTAFTGASGVTIVALGGIVLPMLVQQKYPERFSVGLVTASGSIGLLFPPSLPIILYGLIASVSIDQLFVAGALPGLVLVGILTVYGIRVSYTAKVPRVPFVWSELWSAIRASAWELPLPVIIIGGIYGGAFTAIEAAAITAFYVFIVEVFVYRDLHLTRDIPRVMRESMVLVGAILAILGVALGLTNYLIDEEVPQHLFELVKDHIDSPITFLLILNGFLIIVGMMMDIFSAIIVVVPLILPIAREFGIDPVHLGIIFLTNLEIGYLTPPVGLNLFLASLRFEKPVFEVVRSVVVFIALELVALAVITYVPDLSLWLVRALGTQ
ncbi:MAG: C4-dicarboxylate ABC transporter [Ignavibacteria bacterium GWA2_55_11]|nr:MAG: C4-dicarboxylate ABC transporter [Ignavibacteria bacterium GWA2_55_11]OGU44400.1 MAG: C4-dicarboxylate ABC transporter [Ignavibacteria bacterium GWC2_56_12]OGU70426.1 MAG: C4-dicarboxylate ABC transporter [Ignavibacteria bacterium RIFCSPLOWO2_12_FULL_56_21]OGU75705.1 MAG: C4-dicarboxylate ABC transporter [Ignavibacteria bacterium RIFCSPLOWO2_02_FULL_55_14]HAV23186.1 C4-dicarboxylate ABC transporter [Bacteroidota bacterium]